MISGPGSISEHFANLKDPRIDRTKDHPLINVLVIALCGIICGADDWVEIEAFGKAKREWLSKHLDLSKGIPSHDTFGRVFARLDPERFQEGFLSWMQAVSTLTGGQVIALDGKQLRGSSDGHLGKRAITMVSAYATQNHLVLAQTQVDQKSNEITALPKLLDILEIAGCIITIDAIGCQTDIAAQIVEKEADYVLTLKANQGKLYEDTSFFFAEARRTQFAGITHDHHKTIEKGHGRIETRECWVIDPHHWPEHFRNLDKWAGLQAIACIHSERHILATNKVECNTSYHIASLAPRAKPILNAKRGHWRIENTVHWTLDISFDEDNNRVRTGAAPANLATLRHIALNLLKHEKSAKASIKTKRLKCAWDEDYLLKVLQVSFH